MVCSVHHTDPAPILLNIHLNTSVFGVIMNGIFLNLKFQFFIVDM